MIVVPVKEIALERMKELVDFLNKHTDLYEQGKPEISDKEWDENYFKLVKLESEWDVYLPNSPTQSIRFETVSNLEKVKHNHPMLSLAKTKDWNEFVRYFNYKDVIGMLKLDGLTCSLRYLNGRLVSAETRGNGEEGENILHNALVVRNIPNRIDYNDELIIDGEIICTYKDFEKYKDEYSCPRNYAAGSIRLLDSAECEKRNLKFVAWNIIKGFDEESRFLAKLQWLTGLGFTTTPWTTGFDWDAKEFLISEAERHGYPIDGLVGRFDDIAYGESLGTTGHHSKAAYAFKFYDEVYETELVNIEWTMGRTGVLTPTAIVKPVEIDGCIIERASLHNISIVEELFGETLPYVGQKISIYRANQIIPQIAEVDRTIKFTLFESLDIPSHCPYCGEKTEIQQENDSKVLVCVNPNCSEKIVNRFNHFCGKDGLDIKGLSTATLDKLIDWGWLNTYSDIFELYTHREEWIKKDGFGIKSVDNILNAIELSKNCELDKFIAALGIPLIGTRASQDLSEFFGSWANLINSIDSNFKFYDIPNFGFGMHDAITKFDYTEAKNLVAKYIIFKEEEKTHESAETLAGMNIVITGKLNHFKNRAELKKLIEISGGKVVDSVSSKTSILINNDIDGTSSKNLNAKKLNIPIMTEEVFIDTYLTM